MKILMINKFYFVKGGSERYYFELTKILKEHGHQVIPFSMKHPLNFPTKYAQYFVDHVEFNYNSKWAKFKRLWRTAPRIIYSIQARKRLGNLIRKVRPDIAHLHMIDHQISPSILHTLRAYRIPVILTAHQSKIICPNYRLFNWYKKQICEKCLDHHYYHPIFERCHKNSTFAGMLLAIETYFHKMMKIYEKNVDIIHVPSMFFRNKFREANVIGPQIIQLYYTIQIDQYRPNYNNRDYFVYFGRLEEAKGLETLLMAMRKISSCNLYIVGKGYYQEYLEKLISKFALKNVNILGAMYGDELKRVISKAKFVVVPSECYDNSPLVIYEAYALGKPVIGSNIGGIPELIDNKVTGLLFKPGDSEELASKIKYFLDNPDLTIAYGRNARKKAEREFSPEVHYYKIINIYKSLVKSYHE